MTEVLAQPRLNPLGVLARDVLYTGATTLLFGMSWTDSLLRRAQTVVHGVKEHRPAVEILSDLKLTTAEKLIAAGTGALALSLIAKSGIVLASLGMFADLTQAGLKFLNSLQPGPTRPLGSIHPYATPTPCPGELVQIDSTNISRDNVFSVCVDEYPNVLLNVCQDAIQDANNLNDRFDVADGQILCVPPDIAYAEGPNRYSPNDLVSGCEPGQYVVQHPDLDPNIWQICDRYFPGLVNACTTWIERYNPELAHDGDGDPWIDLGTCLTLPELNDLSPATPTPSPTSTPMPSPAVFGETGMQAQPAETTGNPAVALGAFAAMIVGAIGIFGYKHRESIHIKMPKLPKFQLPDFLHRN